MWAEKLKNRLFSTFFHLFGVQRTCTPLEMIQCIQIPFWGHKLHHYWSKRGKKVEKSQFFNFSGHIYRLRCSWEVLKSDPKARFWCSLSLGRDFGICQVVSKCLLMFLRHLGGSKMTQSKKCHFSAPIPYWKQPYLDLIFAGISHLLFGGFNAFSSPIG